MGVCHRVQGHPANRLACCWQTGRSLANRGGVHVFLLAAPVFRFAISCSRPVFSPPTESDQNPGFWGHSEVPRVKPSTTTEKKQKKGRVPICGQEKNTSRKRGRQTTNTNQQRRRPGKQRGKQRAGTRVASQVSVPTEY